MQLYEKYRPQTLNDFIGQPKIKTQIERLMARPGWDRDAIWIQGPSGTGKTTLAWIIARQVANDFEIIELDGDKCSVQAVREIENHIRLTCMFGKWKAWIVNEAHAMSRQAVQAWLTLLERLPANRLVIFTTTELLRDVFSARLSRIEVSGTRVANGLRLRNKARNHVKRRRVAPATLRRRQRVPE